MESFVHTMEHFLSMVHPIRCKHVLREPGKVKYRRWFILLVLVGGCVAAGVWATKRNYKP